MSTTWWDGGRGSRGPAQATAFEIGAPSEIQFDHAIEARWPVHRPFPTLRRRRCPQRAGRIRHFTRVRPSRSRILLLPTAQRWRLDADISQMWYAWWIWHFIIFLKKKCCISGNFVVLFYQNYRDDMDSRTSLDGGQQLQRRSRPEKSIVYPFSISRVS